MRAVLAVAIGLTMTSWVALDADRRGRNWFAWATIVALTGVVGLVSWLGSRRRSKPAEISSGTRHRLAVALTSVPLMAVSVMVTGFIVTFLFQTARVEGGAMAPTLEDQDRLIVNKVVYQFAEPRVFDIVMLHYPLNPENCSSNVSFSKRETRFALWTDGSIGTRCSWPTISCRTNTEVRTTGVPK